MDFTRIELQTWDIFIRKVRISQLNGINLGKFQVLAQFFENEVILDMTKILKFKAGLVSNMDVSLNSLVMNCVTKLVNFDKSGS